MKNKLITLKTFMFLSDCYTMVSKLESEGIECFLGNENTISAHPFLSQAIGGVKLKIKESDSEKALKILKNYKETEDEIITKERTGVSRIFTKKFIKVESYCPKCDSKYVYRRKYTIPLIVLAIILSPLFLFLVLIPRRHYCLNCNHEWKQ